MQMLCNCCMLSSYCNFLWTYCIFRFFLYDLNSTGVIDDTPKPVVPPLKIVPKEENRTGANKKTYFVCHERKLLLINILVK